MQEMALHQDGHHGLAMKERQGSGSPRDPGPSKNWIETMIKRIIALAIFVPLGIVLINLSVANRTAVALALQSV